MSEMRSRKSDSNPILAYIYNTLSDGSPQTIDSITEGAALTALQTDYPACVTAGNRRGKHVNTVSAATSGGRHRAQIAIHRAVTRGYVEKHDGSLNLSKSERDRWNSLDNTHFGDATSNQSFGRVSILPILGISEWEGWPKAPLVARDVAHIGFALDQDLMELRGAFPGFDIVQTPEGSYTISGHHGAPVKTVVMEWIKAGDVPHRGVRDSSNVRRRNLRDLDPAFRDEIIHEGVKAAQGAIAKKHRLSMDVLAEGSDDAAAWTFLWVVELAEKFDATRGVPFQAYVRLQIPRNIQDLNRFKQGRTASDSEIKLARAQENLEATLGRAPTRTETAKHLGISIEKLHKQETSVAAVKSIRTAAPLDSGPDAAEIPIPSNEETPEESALSREMRQQLSLALIEAAIDPTPGRQGLHELPLFTPTSTELDPHTGEIRDTPTSPVTDTSLTLGFLVTYLSEYTSWTKSDLIVLSPLATPVVNEQVDLLHQAARVRIERLPKS